MTQEQEEGFFQVPYLLLFIMREEQLKSIDVLNNSMKQKEIKKIF